MTSNACLRASCLLSLVLVLSACEPTQSHARCEQGQAVYRGADGSEIERIACMQDEQCVELSPKQAVCRLFETCEGSPPPECRGDALVRCNPGEEYREQIDCISENHGKSTPGRCALDASPEADCVDSGATKCDVSFEEACLGDDRVICLSGYTSQDAACNEAQLAQGGTCLLNEAGSAVCAQPGAEACTDNHWGYCDEQGDVITCAGGFTWREICPEGQSCGDVVHGDVVEAGCQ
jgi:hypothetical protein